MLLSGRPRRIRGAAGLATVAASSALLAGCVQISSQEGAQLEGVGDVAVTLDLCQNSSFAGISTFDASSECTLSDPDPAGKPVQLFVTYAIPVAAAAPTELTAGGASGEKLVADDASTAALTGDLPAPTGHKWVSYRSAPTAALTPQDTAGRSGKITAAFDVSGLSGDFSYAALVGWRFVSTDQADTEFAVDRPVTCGSTGAPSWMLGSARSSYAYPLPGTSCMEAVTPQNFSALERDGRRAGRILIPSILPTPFIPPTGTPSPTLAPTPEPTEAPTPEPSPTPVPDPTITTEDGYTLLTVPVNRLALSGAAEQTVTAGDSATLSFGATSHLASKPVTVPLSGSTDAPGATVQTDGSLAIGGNADVKALVKVPATTPAGDYTVTLSAGAKSGLRTAKATLHVKAAAAAPAATATPVKTPAVVVNAQAALEDTSETLAQIVQRSKKTKQLRRGAATVPVAVTGPGTVRVTIHSRKKVGKNFAIYAVGETYAKKAGSVDVTIKRTDLGRELLKGDEPVKATLVVRFSGPSGKFVAPGIFITLD